jgi:monofunctional glycosyltransferase
MLGFTITEPMLETPPQTRFGPWRARVKKALIVLALAPFVLSLFYAALPPPVTTLMLWKVWGRGIDYRWVSIEEMSPALPKAVLAAEDTRFCLNGAIDWESVSDALEDDDGPRRGASTITMQLAKNLFLWPGRSYLRKVLEAPIAIWIDLMWSKQRVLEVYLNVAEFGPGIYGAEAAARHHFKKPAAKLTGRESALLAAVLPNPIKRVAGKPSPGVRRYAARIAGRVSGTIPFLSCLDIKGL